MDKNINNIFITKKKFLRKEEINIIMNDVHEVFCVCKDSKIDCDWHMERLQRSLSELRIPLPISSVALKVVFCETVRRNRFKTGVVYV